MEVSELRVGNMVGYNGSAWRVYSIKGKSPNSDPKYSDKVLVDLWNNGIITVSLDKIYPLEITEGILKDLNFRFDEGKRGNYYLELHIESESSNKWVQWFINDKTVRFLNIGKKLENHNLCTEELHKVCEYIHELQNMWYIMFNEELNL